MSMSHTSSSTSTRLPKWSEGLLLEIKGEIPKIGEKLTHYNYTFILLEMDERRISKVKVVVSKALQ